MRCPFCGEQDTKVIDSRLANEGHSVRRRRECLTCSERYTTYEQAELALPWVIKGNGQREPFNIDKLRAGIERAIEKRPVRKDQVDAAVEKILHQARACGEREINSSYVGIWVMEQLRELDNVAYIRFASVYRKFTELSEFREEVERLEREEGIDKHSGDLFD